MYLFSLFFLFLLIFYIWHTVDLLKSRKYSRAVNTSSNPTLCVAALEEIIRKYSIQTKTVDYVEPGSGYGFIARALSKRFMWKSVTAIEITGSADTIARLLTRIGGQDVQHLKQDLFTYEFPKNSFIYCYISTPMLNKLYSEGKFHGCFVVSQTFAILDVQPTEVIPLPNWQKRILVYDFR